MAKSDYQSILKLLQKSNIDHGSDVYIKSLQESSKFKKFTGKQSKDFVDLLTKSRIFPYHFNNYFHTLIKELCIDKAVNIDELNVIDRILITIQLRATNIKPTVVDQNITYNLLDHVDRIKSMEVPQDTVVQIDNFEVTVGYPTLEVENSFDKLLMNTLDQLSEDDDQRSLLAIIFLYNVLSYIKNIKMIDGEQGIDFDYDQKTVNQKIEIGQTITSNVIAGVAEQIEQVYSPILRDIIKVQANDSSYILELTPAFFLE